MACGYCHTGPGNVRTCQCADARAYRLSGFSGGAASKPNPTETTEEIAVRDNVHALERPPTRVRRRRITPSERKYIWEQSHRHCYICKTPLPQSSSWHVEHVVAFSEDPTNNDVLGNMLAACATCNLKKLDRPLVTIVQEFACDLDTAAIEASHLNTVARGSLLRALKLKSSLYHAAHRPESGQNGASTVDTTILEAIEEDMSRSLEVADAMCLPPGEFQFVEKRTSHGTYGDVYRGTWRQAVAADPEVLDVAIKFPIGGRGSVLTGELKALSELTGHPNIVRFLGVLPHTWTTRTGDADHGLVFEWCDFHLKTRRVVQNANLVELVAQVADALDFLHGQQPKPYIHRDVKPLNILV